jgi:hypothetical protein
MTALPVFIAALTAFAAALTVSVAALTVFAAALTVSVAALTVCAGADNRSGVGPGGSVTVAREIFRAEARYRGPGRARGATGTRP